MRLKCWVTALACLGGRRDARRGSVRRGGDDGTLDVARWAGRALLPCQLRAEAAADAAFVGADADAAADGERFAVAERVTVEYAKG